MFTFRLPRHLKEKNTMTRTDLSHSTEDEIRSLYKKWPDVKRFMKTIGCNSQDAEDIFQEALLIYIRKKELPDFVLTVEPFHYVKNTCKFIWYNQSRKQAKNRTIESDNDIVDMDDDWFQKEMMLQQIEKAISTIGKKCQELLQLFYGLGWSMVDIAKKIGLRNDKVAKAQKYRCINKVKEHLASDTSTHH